MIIDTGLDIVDIRRLKNSIQKYGKNFLDRVYTQAEQLHAPTSDTSRAAYFAGRWAAKEAIAKALGTGIGAKCAMTDMDIGNDNLGKPVLTLSGNGLLTARERGISTIHISISHERDFAVAQAIAEG